MFWGFFGHKTCGILALWPGIKPAPPALEGEVLTTGPPGKSLNDFITHILFNIYLSIRIVTDIYVIHFFSVQCLFFYYYY